ncbi:Oxidation resistance protein 1 [Wickerhamomyces ciferrii]|uniref:Oxidation resistance protein 1 n=1 Tax=Wickerhamomyces ciferrii (strain ATCC 14091 / BCRC 22168 / CBS 111 / JCM 3599 / NBRC 0793 / NRRL Y-1031 F-60-10) TaxID=1206466 RepID=K0KKG8_WICCF|nr:Oxidation resistance protein 1 [Wickerhamomyces ciferrii]CCH41964.1 Oxidation resistance protein 1 [Wickerhamomyces ciferrii]
MPESTFTNSLKGFFKKQKSPSPSPESNTSSKSPSIRNNALFIEDPPLTPLELHGYSKTTKNKILTLELGEEIRNMLPSRHQVSSNWELVYSLEQHGASLNTLYSNIKPSTKYDKNGYLLVIKDQRGTILGSYTNEHFHPTDMKRFYGNGECFLWKSKLIDNKESGEKFIRFQAFPYTGLNDFIIYCTSKFLSLGGGDGHYGLWIDQELLHGVSDHSLTFGNEPLSSQGNKFSILGVEVWRIS